MKILLPNLRFYYQSIFFALFLFLNLNLVHSQIANQSDFGFIAGENYEEDVVYKTVDGKNLVMDIFYPDEENMQAENPWVVFIHGGGWAGGHRDNIFKTAFIGGLQKLVGEGVIVATIQYRLAKSPDTSFESVVDSKDAARFLIANASQYNLDPDNYAVWGGSAGGHLSLVTALVPDVHFPGDASLSSITPDYKCVVAYYPLTSCLNEDLRPNSIFEDGTLFDRLLGGSPEEEPELALHLSPTEYLDALSLPIYLIHGEDDTTLPVINSTYMKEVADQESADVELLVVENAEHSFGGGNISPSLNSISIKTANFILDKFGYSLLEDEEEILPDVFEPKVGEIYNIYNPRWDVRMGADGTDELIVLNPTQSDAIVQWMFTPVSNEDGFYYIDGVGGDSKSRVTAGTGEVSIMAANTVMGDEAKWEFGYYDETDDGHLFWITNKNGRRLRAWGDHVDIVPSNSSGTYTRFSFSESTALSLDDDILKRNISIYPTPTSEVLNIELKTPVLAEVSIMDITGKLKLSKKIGSLSNELNVSSLPSGFYIVKVQSENAVYIQKIIKY